MCVSIAHPLTALNRPRLHHRTASFRPESAGRRHKIRSSELDCDECDCVNTFANVCKQSGRSQLWGVKSGFSNIIMGRFMEGWRGRALFMCKPRIINTLREYIPSGFSLLSLGGAKMPLRALRYGCQTASLSLSRAIQIT